ncbi:unnamed protein product [Pleuronectes platessa]|uniref:Uncharacterized protein n=1 Tax=Pleuronectes platessa TaxID=8262 RepID=A0A9N7TJ12_PLEPL|nr:unnamed protein product [Pleuronectes platessa]
MPLDTIAPSNKRKKSDRIITDLSNISQNDDEADPEASEFDLGTKIKTPKDLMLEELSLLSNKGSKMFRMRQQRVDKFIVTNQNMQNLENLLMCPPPVAPKPEMPKVEVVEEPVDEEAEKEAKSKEYIRTYVSPWERAMRGNVELTATMRGNMPGPIQIHPDLILYKSFNRNIHFLYLSDALTIVPTSHGGGSDVWRTALPFGGNEKASKILAFELPEPSVANDEPESLASLQADIRSRPSFNRTPIGWVCSEDNSNIHMDEDNLAFEGETDDL